MPSREYYRTHLEICLRAMRRYALKHKEELAKKAKAYREKNAARLREYRKQYCKLHAAEARKRVKLWKQAHPEWARQIHREWLNQNRDKTRRNVRKWQQKNPEKVRAMRRSQWARYRATKSPRWWKSLLRTRVLSALRGKGVKSHKTMDLIGCTIEHLKLHLQSQFKPGMQWNNHGPKGWHIDHIVPCARFDLSKPEEQKRAFHYTNLQPLWAHENQAKRDRVTP